MGAFNTLDAVAVCPKCENPAQFNLQFRFGDTWQHNYKLLDNVSWGGNDVGRPGLKRVIVHAYGNPCPHCKTALPEFEITVVRDQLVSVSPTNLPDPQASPGYRIEEE
jgi:hypothetical protein